MNRARFVPIFLAIAVAGCAADGGQRGSGITSAVGNVASVADDAGAGVANIHVSIEGAELATDTDAQGRFSVRGQFDGATTLLFERVSDRLAARLTVNAPAGGALTLQNVRVDGRAGQAQAETTQVVFEGRIVGFDCAGGRLTLASTQANPEDTDTYVVALQTSTLRDRRNGPHTCGDLRADDRLAVDGFYADDGTIGNATVIVE